MLTFILIHGALLASDAWMPVQSYLQNHGYNVVTVDVPGRSEDNIAPQDVTLTLAAEKICKVAKLQGRRVILVGHSQSGAVITQAQSLCSQQIAGLVYVAAVVPANGEKPFDLLSEQDGANFDKVAVRQDQQGIYKINYQGPIKEMFMQDASDTQAQHAIHNMVSEPIRIGDYALQYDELVFAVVPKFYIKTRFDLIISPETQNKYLARTQFRKVYELNTGHSPFVSQAKVLGRQLSEIYDVLAGTYKR